MRLLIFVLATCILSAQTKIDLHTQARRVDFSAAESTKPFRTGNALPVTCSMGEAFLLLTALPGQNLYTCIATNMWVTNAAKLPEGGSMGDVLTWNPATAAWVPGTALATTAVHINGVRHGARTVQNYVVGNGMILTAFDDGSAIQLTHAVDTAVMQTRANAQSGADLLLSAVSADGVVLPPRCSRFSANTPMAW
jgi:hypothetical protein